MNSRIRDARKELGMPQTFVLGLQHVFAMFGATVTVPLLTGLSVSVTLFCAGIATLWFHFITKGKIPVFLGSSFAFLGAYAAVAPFINGEPNIEMLHYASGGVVCAGLVYVVFALIVHFFGKETIKRLIPPIVTGPIIILIGITLAPSALSNCLAGTGYYLDGAMVEAGTAGAVFEPRFIIAIIAIAVIIICNVWGKGLIKVIPILCGIVVSYIVAAVFGWTKPFGFDGIVKLPPFLDYLPKFDINAIITFCVVSFVAMIEHIGDIAAIGATCGENFYRDPGLTRTLLGDGIGTTIAGFFGGPANTTYSENTGVIALTKVEDPFVIRLAAVFTIILSLVPAVDGFINTIPSEVIGGISFILYGMISAVGLRNLVEYKVDFSNQRNVIIAAVILVSGLAFNATPIVIGKLSFGGLACAAIFGVLLNAILPGHDYDFVKKAQSPTILMDEKQLGIAEEKKTTKKTVKKASKKK